MTEVDIAPRTVAWPTQENQILVAPFSASRGYLSWVFQLNGPLDPNALSAALDDVVRRFPVLRTTFERRDDVLYQSVAPFAPGVLDHVELTHLPKGDALTAAVAHAEEVFRGLSPEHQPSLRATLYAVARKTHVLAVFVAEALVDGDSGTLLADEISRAYAVHAGHPVPDRPPAAPESFVAAVADAPVSPRQTEQAKEYWRGLLRQALPGLGWAPPGESTATVSFDLPGPEWAEVVAVAQGLRTTPYVFALAAFQAALARAADAPRLLVTSVVSRRGRATQRMIGCFYSSVLVDARVEDGDRFTDVVARTARSVALAIGYAAVPAPLVMCDPADPAALPPTAGVHFYLFDSREAPTYQGVRLRRFRFHSDSREALRLNCTRRADGAQAFVLSSSAVGSDVLERLAETLRTVVRAAVADPEVPLAGIGA